MILRRLTLNGRFLGQPITGVQRLAIELTRAIRERLQTAGRPDLAVAVPRGTLPSPSLDMLGSQHPNIVTIGRLTGHLWEQIRLPWVRRETWLLSLCNVGPMLRRRQALMICDAQFLLHPESYSWAFRTWYRVLLSVLSRRSAVVFTISQFSKAALERYGIVPHNKVHVIKLGVDHLDRLDPDENILIREGLKRESYILAIGSLARHKNLTLLVDAFINARLPAVTLVIAGGGNQRVFQRAGLRSAPNVRYTGRVSDGELKALYANALAFACPSLSEGFGFTPLEAMVNGCPVVATTGGAVPEICGDAAVYADPYDRAAWQHALSTIVNDVQLRDTLSHKARDRAALYKWQAAAREVLAVLAFQDGDQALLAAMTLPTSD